MARATKTRGQRARLVRRWRASGLSQAAFARQQGLQPRTFWGWCREVPTTRARVTPRFLPVRVMAADPEEGGAAGVEILLVSGDRVRVAPGTAPVLVAAVVAALRSSC